MRYLLANWKFYKGHAEDHAWNDFLLNEYTYHPDLVIGLAVNFLILPSLSEKLRSLGTKNVVLIAQDVSPFPRGSYTGAIAADMLKNMADYVIVGHSERRRYFHESGQDVINKISETVDAGLGAVVCLENADSSLLTDTLKDQGTKNIILAYTPADTINFNIPESPQKVTSEVARLAQTLPGLPIVYGGKINESNISEYAGVKGLSGVFVGAASLDVRRFLKLYTAMLR